MKGIYFGSNLKMYKTSKETLAYLNTLAEKTKDLPRDKVKLFIIPSYTSLELAVRAIDQGCIKLGAQNMCAQESGQFTGEISPLMLKEIGVELILVGHSERRHIFGENDYVENEKVLAALKNGFTTLLCVGETKAQKDYKAAEEILGLQIKIGLNSVQEDDLSRVWLAYEPVWSIGVEGIPADKAYVEKMHQYIKKTLRDMFGEKGNMIPVLYGGSVNPGNARELSQQHSVDGLFIGRAAWDADSFNKLIRSVLGERIL